MGGGAGRVTREFETEARIVRRSCAETIFAIQIQTQIKIKTKIQNQIQNQIQIQDKTPL